MDSVLKGFLTSGKQLLGNTKTPKPHPASKKEKVAKAAVLGEMEQDPHKRFIRRVIREKPKKAELVKDFERFIEAEEQML